MNAPFAYPLQLKFKLLALAPQIYVRDAQGSLLGYVRQKLLALREAVTVFADEAQTQPLFAIKADRVFDFRARYDMFRMPDGTQVGAVKQQGMRSLWRLHMDIYDALGNSDMVLREENPWIKMLDELIGELPIIGAFTGYFLNPTYRIDSANGTPLLRIKKHRSFLESSFTIDKLAELPPDAEQRAVLALIMMILLHRSRG
jgi:uncharacterized protein YxjI